MFQNQLRICILLFLLVHGLAARSQYTDHRNRKVDSLETLLNSENPPTGENLIRAYDGLMWGYLQTDGEKSKEYAQKALELSYEINALNARVNALRILGLLSYGGDDYDKAIDYFNEALAVTEQMKGDKRYRESDIDDNLSVLYGSIANVYNMEDKAHLAIHYYQLALPIFEKYHWMESMTILYHNIGELYGSMGNDIESERNYMKAVEASLASGDSLLIALPHKGLAKLYLDREDFAKAEESAQICYDYYSHHIEEEIGDYVTTLLNLARIQLNKYHDVDRAEAYVNEAVSLLGHEMLSETEGDIYNACCEIAMERKQWRKAEEYAWKAIDAGEFLNYNDLGSYFYLTKIYAEMGETQKVKECVTTIYGGMRQFATESYQSSLSQMEVLYETEKKQLAIEQLKKEKQWLTSSTILIAIVLIMIALLFFLLWRNVRQSKKNAVVKAKLDGELSERVRIARDLHDRMGGLLTAIKQNVPAQSQADVLTDEAIAEMRNVSHHLLPESLKRYGLRTALRDYCKTMKKVEFSFVGEEHRVEHEEMVYCVVHELVNNAVKSAEAHHIHVQLTVDKDITTVNVSDDGNGNIDMMETEGSGLRNIKERVEAIGGHMEIYAKPGEGSEINIDFQNEKKDD